MADQHTQPDSDVASSRHDVLKWLSVVAAAVVSSMVATHFSAQSQTETSFRERLSILETQMGAVLKGIDEIKGDVRAGRQDQQLVLKEWANGVNKRTLEPLPTQAYIDQFGKPPR